MNIGRRSACALLALGLLFLVGIAGQGWMSPAQGQGNPNGAAGQMPAYYDGELFTVNMKEMPNSDPLIEHNKSINMIFVSNDLDEEQITIPVIDAIQGDGFNPLWQQILIVPPTQFTSDTDVLAAAEAGTITLVPTDEVYRCSVVGPGPKNPER